jgi:hypothetical protein
LPVDALSILCWSVRLRTSRIDVFPAVWRIAVQVRRSPDQIAKHRIDDDCEARHTCYKNRQEIDQTRRDRCTDLPSQRLSRARPPSDFRFLGSRKVRNYGFRRGCTLEVLIREPTPLQFSRLLWCASSFRQPLLFKGIWLTHDDSSSTSALASFRSRLSNPSVNQP